MPGGWYCGNTGASWGESSVMDYFQDMFVVSPDNGEDIPPRNK